VTSPPHPTVSSGQQGGPDAISGLCPPDSLSRNLPGSAHLDTQDVLADLAIEGRR
jgi:hypothetical protein